MINLMKTVITATSEYEMQYGKRPILFINKAFQTALMTYIYSHKYYLDIGSDNMSLYGYTIKLVLDNSDEMHFWLGEEKLICGENG